MSVSVTGNILNLRARVALRGFGGGLLLRSNRPLRCSFDKARCGLDLSVSQRRSSWWLALRERCLEAAALAAPAQVMAGSAEHPLPERRHSECDCEILAGASPAPPRPPW